MKLRKMPWAMAELNQLAKDPELDQNSPAVMASNIYQLIQNTTKLDASYLFNDLAPNALLLLVKISAISPTLHTLNIACNHLYTLDTDYITTLASVIAHSQTIHTLDIRRNFLGDHVFTFIEASIEHSALKFIDIRWNSLQGVKRSCVVELIKGQNEKVLEWQKALEYLNLVADTSLEIEGDVTSVIGEVAFLTNDNHLLKGDTLKYSIDDSCVIS